MDEVLEGEVVEQPWFRKEVTRLRAKDMEACITRLRQVSACDFEITCEVQDGVVDLYAVYDQLMTFLRLEIGVDSLSQMKKRVITIRATS